jgi:hypothetical protein
MCDDGWGTAAGVCRGATDSLRAFPGRPPFPHRAPPQDSPAGFLGPPVGWGGDLHLRGLLGLVDPHGRDVDAGPGGMVLEKLSDGPLDPFDDGELDFFAQAGRVPFLKRRRLVITLLVGAPYQDLPGGDRHRASDPF